LFKELNQIDNLVLPLEDFFITNCELVIKREDQLHPYISGNKYRKLKYNLIEANNKGYDILLTFGGAYSNHIAAVASAGKEYGFKTIGVIRGEELIDKIDSNPTLQFAKSCGMNFHFISREVYGKKNELNFIDNLKTTFGDFYLLPEGGTNDLAVEGCSEILTQNDAQFDYICSAVGTGGTIAGLIESSNAASQTVLGFSALKGTFQISEINSLTSKRNYKILDDYCFGGYAKVNSTLIDFINDFKCKTSIPLDPVYTGKMVYGIIDLIKKGVIRDQSKILAIHTGGLQGIAGMNKILLKKNLPLIR
jgi:1-aminocyclopropane-1-carboxylate deaminase